MQIVSWIAGLVGMLLLFSVYSHWKDDQPIRASLLNSEFVCNNAMLDGALGHQEWIAKHACGNATTGMLHGVQSFPADLLDQMFGPRNAAPNLHTSN